MSEIKEKVEHFKAKIPEIQKRYYEIFQKNLIQPKQGFKPPGTSFSLFCSDHRNNYCNFELVFKKNYDKVLNE